MKSITDIKTLIKDREEILRILKAFNIDILKLENKYNSYIIWLGGINKLLYQKNKVEVDSALINYFLDKDFKNKNVKFIFR